jgi:hypothetical protein
MISKKLVISAIIALALTACGGGAGGGGGVVPSTGGSGPTSTDMVVVTNPDIFDLQDSGLLAVLESDVGETATSTQRVDGAVSRHQLTTTNFSFETQITGGYATIARPKGVTLPGIGFIATTRDATGSCECSNDSSVAPNKPYRSALTNPSWPATPYVTYASTTSLGIAYRSNGTGGDHGGTYTFGITSLPSGDTNSCIAACQFTIAGSGAVQLPIQPAPVVTGNGDGTTTISWTPAAGTMEYYVALIAHHENEITQPAVIVGFIVTDKTSTKISNKNLYAGAPYQALVIGSDQDFISIYLSQGATQLPAMPKYVDFSLSQVTQFTAQ